MSNDLELSESSYTNCRESGWSQQAAKFVLQKTSLTLIDTEVCQGSELGDSVRKLLVYTICMYFNNRVLQRSLILRSVAETKTELLKCAQGSQAALWFATTHKVTLLWSECSRLIMPVTLQILQESILAFVRCENGLTTRWKSQRKNKADCLPSVLHLSAGYAPVRLAQKRSDKKESSNALQIFVESCAWCTNWCGRCDL